MKKIVFMSLIFLTVFLISCGGSDDQKHPEENGNDEDTAETADNNQPDEIITDEENVNDEEQGIVEEPDETEEPDENQNTSDFEAIGTFNLSYSGQVNASVDMQSRGGKGKTEFVYRDQPVTFDEINIGISLFPLAMLNSGNIVIVWLDSFGLGDLQGTAEKQVFGISVPQNTGTGSGTLASANIYAFYGDMIVNISGGQFDIKCVRSVSNVGNYEVTENTGSSLSMTANGDLLDPSAGAAYLPYPACE